jgi:hypothetical protein
MFCFCCDRSFNPDPCDCVVEHCLRCLNCARHCPCPDPQLVGDDEADEPEVIGLSEPARQAKDRMA